LSRPHGGRSRHALSLNPGLLAADAALCDTIMHAASPLSRAERECLALTVSRVNPGDGVSPESWEHHEL